LAAKEISRLEVATPQHAIPPDMYGTRTIQPLFLLFHEKAGITDIAGITRLTCWTAAQSQDTLASFLFVGRHAGCGYLSILRFSRDTQPVHARPEAGRHVWTNVRSMESLPTYQVVGCYCLRSSSIHRRRSPPSDHQGSTSPSLWVLGDLAHRGGTITWDNSSRASAPCSTLCSVLEAYGAERQGWAGQCTHLACRVALPCWLTRSGL
jgi:hypothetical protein